MADAWIDAGWNVGSFYWTQFADAPTQHSEVLALLGSVHSAVVKAAARATVEQSFMAVAWL